jgi:hypothetical protein
LRKEREGKRSAQAQSEALTEEITMLKEQSEKLKNNFLLLERENKEYKKFMAERE